MAKVKITGHASGTGVITVTSPDTSTDRTITLPDSSGTLLDENSSVPAANITGTLPAISGANLTGLTSSLDALTDCTVSASTPTVTSNPSAVGHLWIEEDTGECYVCTDATNNANIWTNIGEGSGHISASITTFDIFGDSSCVALWHLDSNKNDAGGNYNLTSSGTEGWTNGGKFGGAWDGSESNLLYYASSNIVGTGGHSASFWYKNTLAAQDNKRVFTVNGGTGGQCAGFNNYNNSLGFYTGSGVNVGGSIPAVNRRVEIPDATVNDSAWHHLAWSITSGGTWVLYLDGSEWTGTANTGDNRSFNSGSYVIITGYAVASGTPHEGDVFVDQVRLFNRVITATEVATLNGLG